VTPFQFAKPDAGVAASLFGARAEGAGYYAALADKDSALVGVVAGGRPAAIAPTFDIRFDMAQLMPVLAPMMRLPRLVLPGLGRLHLGGLGAVHSNELGLTIDPALPPPERDTALGALLDGYERDGRARDMTLIKDVSDRDSHWADPVLRRRGYYRIEGLPLAWLHLPYDSLEHYLAARPYSKVRRSLNANIRGSAAVQVEIRGDCGDVEAEMEALAAATRENAGTGFDGLEAFPPGFFSRFAALAPEHARFLLYRVDGRLLGFCFCLVADNVLYAKTVGMAYPEAQEHRIYFRNIVTLIEMATRERRPWLCLGQLSYDIKLRWGARLEKRWIYFRLRGIYAPLGWLSQPIHRHLRLSSSVAAITDPAAWFATSPGVEPPPSLTLQAGVSRPAAGAWSVPIPSPAPPVVGHSAPG
jgi:hypothetical protein